MEHSALLSPAGTGHDRSIARVMLVEDSAVVRGMMRRWLDGLAGIEIVEASNNGQVAINRVCEAAPDIIILDIEMPVMDGLTALPELVRRAPKAKILIASTLSQRNAEISLKALHLGASECIAKPSFSRDGNAARELFRDELVRKVQGLSGRGVAADAPSRQTGEAAQGRWLPMPGPGDSFDFRRASRVIPQVIAIGSSTGGPAALSQLFGGVGDVFGRVPVLVTQHMPPTFTALLGDKLARIAGLEGGEAVDGEPLVPGRLYVAPGGRHMRVRRDREKVSVVLDDGPPINHCRPSVEPLFESVARAYGASVLAVVLTGMGSDGALGGVAVADQGGTVLAQDEPSSVVWGMPGAVAAAGAVAGLYPLGAIGKRIAQAFAPRGIA